MTSSSSTLYRGGVKRTDILRKMVDKGYLLSAKVERKTVVAKERKYVFPITDKLLDFVKAEAKLAAGSVQKPVQFNPPGQIHLPMLPTS